MGKRTRVACCALVLAVSGVVAPVATATTAESAAGAQVHLQELEKIAAANNGNRAAGTSGYQASVDYVKGLLDQAGYVTSLQEFDSMSGKTVNLIAETKGGDANNVVMVGAHLDSVTEGPGINDNGSGVAAILDSALRYAEGGQTPKNKLRFAFWGAEEQGLLGSSHYVETLPEAEREQVSMYLNFDMVGSHNAGYFTYDGDDSDGEGAGPGPEGSAQIEKLLNDTFSKAGTETEGTDFDGRSDYGPFIEVGIPAGGVFTGADGAMTQEQAAKWGGQAGAPYDECYHRSCDTFEYLNKAAFDHNTQVIFDAVSAFAAQ